MKEKNKYFIQNGMISRFDFMDNQEFLPLPTVCSLLNDNEEKHDKLAEKFVIVSKALELACEDLLDNDVSMCEYCGVVGNCIDECPDENAEMSVLIDYFIKKAKEIINGYKQDD